MFLNRIRPCRGLNQCEAVAAVKHVNAGKGPSQAGPDHKADHDFTPLADTISEVTDPWDNNRFIDAYALNVYRNRVVSEPRRGVPRASICRSPVKRPLNIVDVSLNKPEQGWRAAADL